MKTTRSIFLMLILASFFAGCKDTFIERRTYQANVPEYMSYDEMRQPVKSSSATEIDVQGKIYIKDNYLYINEKYKGIHVYDNSNPANPLNITTLWIPGNVDFAIVDHYLYADSYVDLVVIDISDLESPREVARIKDIFPYTIPELPEENYSYPISSIDQTKGVITGWKVQTVTEEIDGYSNPRYFFDIRLNSFAKDEAGFGGGGGGAIQTVGVGGSLARFIINNGQFYGLNQTDMQVIDINTPESPVVGTKILLQRIAETVFIDGNHLFIGTQTGMLVYDISNPSAPAYVSEYNHFQSCDPVVVQDGFAYVTERAGNRCGNWQNLMEVIDINVITNPQLVQSYVMTEPWGLGIDNNKLFICDGAAGLKIYDATDKLRIDQHLLKTFTEVTAHDVIPMGNVLILLAADGIYQYDYSDLNNITLISKIPIGG